MKRTNEQLILAVMEKSIPKIEEIIKNGCSVNNSDEEKNSLSALHIAVGDGSYDIVAYLLDHGAECNVRGGETLSTPLHHAVGNALFSKNPQERAKHLEITKILLRHGADYNLKNRKGKSPLEEAKENEKNPEVYARFKELIEEEKKAKASSSGNENLTPSNQGTLRQRKNVANPPGSTSFWGSREHNAEEVTPLLKQPKPASEESSCRIM